ncbi:hypothetical protein ABT026_05315 [Streptomyces sp. NPDC002734]|uniref:hypothetical protein n=1 Tax=Streptomyces sp. NPDC002734 TaxID=3154426 RepID=UPI003325D137
MSRPWWFPDNTVLCSFAAVDRLALLEKVLDDRGRWTQAVAYEAQRSAVHLPALGGLADGAGWLGEPIEVDGEVEQALVERLRRVVFGGLAHRPLQHLGEAETLAVIETRREFRTAVWITDDADAGRYAHRRGIRVLDTVGVMREAVARGLVPAAEGHRLLVTMRERGRHLRGIPLRPEDLHG